MPVDERELEDRIRVTLAAWADEVPSAAAPPWAAPTPRGRSAAVSWVRRLAPVAVAASVVAAALVLRPTSDEQVVSGPHDYVLAEVRVGGLFGVRVLARGDGAVYVASENDRRLYRVDQESHAVVDGPALAVPDAVAVTADGDAVVAIVDGPRLARLDPTTLAATAAVDLDGEPTGMTLVDGEVWVRDADGTVGRFDTDDLTARGPLPDPAAPGFQTVADGVVWRTDFDAHTVVRIDPDDGTVLGTTPIAGEPRGIVADDDEVWVADRANDRVLRLDQVTGRVEAAVPTGRFPHGLALGDGRLWVTNFEDGTLTTIDTDRNVAVSTVPIGVRPGSIVPVDAGLWVSVHQEGLVRLVDATELERYDEEPLAPDELTVDVGGHDLFLRCVGDPDSARPTVVLEAGVGQWSEHELFVLDDLRSTHRVCAYDRAGLGRSDPGPQPRTVDRVAAELHALLDGAGLLDEPVILVANGEGGRYARAYASAHPDDLAALVLVSAVTPTFWDDFRDHLSSEERAAFDAGRAADPEMSGLDASPPALEATNLGHLPLAVVTGQDTFANRGPDIAELWQQHQQTLLDLSSDSRHITVDGYAFLATDAPAAVADAVRSLG